MFLLDISLPLGSSSAFPMWPWWPWPLVPSGGVRSLVSPSVAPDSPSWALSARPGTPAWFDVTNRALALGTLWATMFLVRRFSAWGGGPSASPMPMSMHPCGGKSGYMHPRYP